MGPGRDRLHLPEQEPTVLFPVAGRSAAVGTLPSAGGLRAPGEGERPDWATKDGRMGTASRRWGKPGTELSDRQPRVVRRQERQRALSVLTPDNAGLEQRGRMPCSSRQRNAVRTPSL